MLELLASTIGVGLSPIKAVGAIVAVIYVRNSWLSLALAASIACAEYLLTLAIFGGQPSLDLVLASIIAGALWWLIAWGCVSLFRLTRKGDLRATTPGKMPPNLG